MLKFLSIKTWDATYTLCYVIFQRHTRGLTVLDVHSPHGKMHGIRDFFLHLFTITVGLLIALGLEGCVERAHHRHLVREAEASLRTEIQNNANAIPLALTELHKQQESLHHDVEVLKYIAQNHNAPADSSMEINFRVHGLTDVA